MITNPKNKFYQLFKWSEKYLKTDLGYLIYGGSWQTISLIINTILSFIVAIAFGFFVPKEVYGNYKYLLSVATILGAVSLSGFSTVITRAVSRGYEGVLQQAFKTTLKWSWPMMIIGFSAAIYYYLHGNTILAISLIIISLTSPIINAGSLYSAFLSGKRDFKSLAIINTIVNLGQEISILLTLWLTQKIIWLIGIYFLSTALLNIFFYIWVKYHYQPSAKGEPGTINYGTHLSILNSINIITGQLDKIILFQLLGGSYLAIYAFAVAPVAQLRSILKLTMPLALPKLSLRSKQEIKANLPAKLRKFNIVLILPVLSYIALSPIIFKLMFPRYLDAIVYSQIYSLSLLFFPKKLISVALLAQAEKRYIYLTNISANIIKLTSLFIFIPLYGIWGAIISELITHLFNNSILILALKKM